MAGMKTVEDVVKEILDGVEGAICNLEDDVINLAEEYCMSQPEIDGEDEDRWFRSIEGLEAEVRRCIRRRIEKAMK